MNLVKSINLVSLFKNLVNDLQSYADEQGVFLNFKSNLNDQIGFYNFNSLHTEFLILIKKIIDFTPVANNVYFFLDLDTSVSCIKVQIINTGINLFRMRQITNEMSYKVIVVGKEDKETKFIISIPLSNNQVNEQVREDKNNLGCKPYYREIETKLSTYFMEIENLQGIADKRGQKEGEFLRKVNAIIESRMSDYNFKVDALASAMALSRAQLFRKIKLLINISPSEYLLYFRLLAARNLLNNKHKELNISEVAYSVGFLSKSHFSRSFHKQFGMSPRSYKKMQLSGNKSQQ